MGRPRTKISFSKPYIEMLRSIANTRATLQAIYDKYQDKIDTSFLVESETDLSYSVVSGILRTFNIKGIPNEEILKDCEKGELLE